jgi:hypothetical protein
MAAAAAQVIRHDDGNIALSAKLLVLQAAGPTGHLKVSISIGG